MKFLYILRKVFTHPLNHGRRVESVHRFLKWQIISRIHKYPVLLPFTDKTHYLCWNGLTGLTGNYYYGLMEMEEMAFVLHYLDEHDTFYDIGANVGAYTILAGLHVGCETFSFEPHPVTFAHLKRNVALGHKESNVFLYNIGLSSEEGKIKFTSDQDTVNHVALPDELNVIEVHVSRLDDLNISQPSVIKIDVEGFELEVIKGGMNTLSSDRLQVVIIELNGSGRRYGYSDSDVDQVLRDLGFSPFTYDPFNRELLSLDSYNCHNTIYLRNTSIVQKKLKSGGSVRLSNGAIL